MLDELSVKDFGIIEEINWKPSAGMNVITGETGAGKSLVVDAVEALLSGQAHEEDIRHGSDEARVEGIFHQDEREGYKALREAAGGKRTGSRRRHGPPCLRDSGGRVAPRRG